MTTQSAQASNVLDVASRFVGQAEQKDDLLKEVRALNPLPDSADLQALALATQRTVASFGPIECAEDLELVSMECQSVKDLFNRIDEQRKGYTGPLNAAVKAINDWYRPALTALQNAEGQYKALMVVWDQELQRQAAEARRIAAERAAAEQARIAEEQRKIEAEREQKRRQEQAQEAERQQRAQAAAQALLQQAAAAQANGDTEAAVAAARAAEQAQLRAQQEAEQARQLAEAREAESRAQAEALLLSSQVMTAALVVPEQRRPEGVARRTQLVVEVTDLHALVKHVAEHPELIHLIKADESSLKAYRKGMGEHARPLPGVTFTDKPVMAVSTRR